WLDRVTADRSPGAAYATAMAAFFISERGEIERARSVSHLALAAARETHDDRALVTALTHVTFLPRAGDDPDHRTSGDEMVDIATRLGDDWWLAFAAAIRGEVARLAGDQDSALHWYGEARAAALRT